MSLTITQAERQGKAKGSLRAVAAFLAFFACWGSVAVAREAAPPLVFIHGLKGSELVSVDGKIQWLGTLAALGFRTPDLRLQTRFDDGTQPLGPLQPGKILARINVLPVLIGVDVYGPWLKAASGMNKAFYQFSYDWRRDNLETMATFAKFLESVKSRHGGKKVQVVGHSMGGMIALAVMNRNPELFDRLVLAGSPLGGGIGFLPDLHQGVSTGLNGDILGPDVLMTFPSVFAFFPDRPGSLVDASGQTLEVDFHWAQSWQTLKLGMYAEGRDPGVGYAGFFEEALARAKRFRELLAPNPGAGDHPPVLVVAGKKVPTLVQAIQDGPNSELGWDFASAPRAPGDGRVAFEQALPPEGIKHEVFETTAEHTDLLSDKAVQKKIAQFLHPDKG
jgi:pimeloyl-ACP methyl ester carboxylesterase